MSEASPLKRREIVAALRIGEVPKRGLELFAVGLERFEKAIDDELDAVAAGGGQLKAVRGEYGTGKTFFARWLEHRARERAFATSLVQISESHTPLHRMEAVYRRAVEALQTKEWHEGAFRSLVDRWFFTLEEAAIEEGVDANDPSAVLKAVGELMEKRLAAVTAIQPQFGAVLRACHSARVAGDHAVAEGLVAWLMGQPNVGPAAKRAADIKGDLDAAGASGFLRGLLEILRQTGRKGLVLVLDEVETIQRTRADSRDKSLNTLRELAGDLALGRYPGLYVLITGTPLFFDGPQGVKRSTALAQRLHTEFAKDPRHDSSRATQIRLQPFDRDKLVTVGTRVRDLYPGTNTERVKTKVSDATIHALADRVTGQFGGRVGVAPRIFLKRVVDLLDKVDEHGDFDPAEHEDIVIAPSEMTAEEREAAGVVRGVDDIELDLGSREHGDSEGAGDELE